MGLYRLTVCILRIWSTYYTIAFNKLENRQKRELSRFLLNYLSDNNDNKRLSEDLFSTLKDQRIFEEKESPIVKSS